MKQKDLALIIVVAVISVVVSLVLSNVIFAPPKNRQQEVEVVPVVTAEFTQPDKRYFNKAAFDPTQLITIGKNDNQNPFNKPATQ